MNDPADPIGDGLENLRTYGRTKVKKYWVERSNETKHRYLTIPSVR